MSVVVRYVFSGKKPSSIIIKYRMFFFGGFRQDFMVIPFQAIEVYLDNVVPIDSKSSSVDALASPSNTDRQIVVSSYIDSFEKSERCEEFVDFTRD